jgi:hypothetical protein
VKDRQQRIEALHPPRHSGKIAHAKVTRPPSFPDLPAALWGTYLRSPRRQRADASLDYPLRTIVMTDETSAAVGK